MDNRKKNDIFRIIIGIVFILTGIVMLANPAGTLISIWLLFSVALIATGIFYVWGYFKDKDLYVRPRLLLAEGIVDILAGVLLLAVSGAAPVVIPWILAFWLILIGLRRIFFALDLKNANLTSWKKVMLTGAIATVLGLLVLFVPLIGAVYLVVITAVFLIYFGIMVILERV